MSTSFNPFAKYDVLPRHNVPVQYAGAADDAEGLTGESEEFDDPDTSSPHLGSGAELGGVSSPTATYDDQSDADVINLTGMSESPMMPIEDHHMANLPPNVNGSGQAGQQVASIESDPDAAVAAVDLTTSLGTVGTSATIASQAPAAATGSPVTTTQTTVLTQTSQSGLSLHANLLLFFGLGVLGAIVLTGVLSARS